MGWVLVFLHACRVGDSLYYPTRGKCEFALQAYGVGGALEFAPAQGLPLALQACGLGGQAPTQAGSRRSLLYMHVGWVECGYFFAELLSVCSTCMWVGLWFQ